jgi:hypothetical protein
MQCVFLFYEVPESKFVTRNHLRIWTLPHDKAQQELRRAWTVDLQRLSHCKSTAQSKPHKRKVAVEVPRMQYYNPRAEREDSFSFRHHHHQPTDPLPRSPQLKFSSLDIIDIHSLSVLAFLVFTLTPILVELEIAISVALLPIRIRLVDLRALR